MKRLILLLPGAIFPYSLLAGLYCFVKGKGNLGEVFSFLPWLFVLALGCNVLFLFLSIWKKWDCRKVSCSNMAVKLLQIPAYAVIFVLGALSFSTLFTMGLAAVLLLFDCASIFLSGLLGVAAVVRGYAEGVRSKKSSVAHGLLQFVFCLDIVSAIMLFAGAKRTRRPAASTSPD